MSVAISVPCGAGNFSVPIMCSTPCGRIASVGVSSTLHGDADDDRRRHRADHQADLLRARRGADQVAGLQILRGGAGVGGGDADHAADAQRHRLVESPVQPMPTKMRQVAISVAIVMPEMGLDDEPMMPTMREATVTKKKPKTTISTPSSSLPTTRARQEGQDRHDQRPGRRCRRAPR